LRIKLYGDLFPGDYSGGIHDIAVLELIADGFCQRSRIRWLSHTGELRREVTCVVRNISDHHGYAARKILHEFAGVGHANEVCILVWNRHYIASIDQSDNLLLIHHATIIDPRSLKIGIAELTPGQQQLDVSVLCSE